MKRLSTTTAILALMGAPAFAQDTFQLPEIVFSAGLTAVEANRAGVTVEVIDEADLEATGDVQLIDVLEQLPGLTVSQSGPPGTAATVRIRGLDGAFIGVRINGIDVTDPSLGQIEFNFAGLTTGSLSRVEVLYGSQSALYGSEAIAGVINITTVEAPDEVGNEVTISGEGGSFDTFFGALTYASRFERGTLTFSASYFETNGFSAADENDGNTEDDGSDALTLTFGGTYDVTDALTLGFDIYYQDRFVEFDSGGGPGNDGPETGDTEITAARVFAQYDGVLVDHEFGVAYTETERFFPGGFTENFDGERLELNYLATVDFGDTTTASVGLEYTDERFDTDTNSGDNDIFSVFGDVLWAVTPNFDLNFSGRLDDNDLFGTEFSGRIAAAWRVTDQTTLRASVGEGIRAASLFELFSDFGDPNLTSEESLSFEASVEQQFSRGFLKVTGFYIEIDDLIDFDPSSTVCGSTFGCFGQVPGTSETIGVEVSGSFDITDRVRVFGNYTYTDAEDADGEQRARVPQHSALIGIDAEITDRWRLNATALGAFDTEVGEFASTTLDDYVVFDATATYALTDNAELYLRVENIFDEEYQTTPGFGTSDRAAFVGVRARF